MAAGDPDSARANDAEEAASASALARALRQRLELLRRSGWHVPIGPAAARVPTLPRKAARDARPPVGPGAAARGVPRAAVPQPRVEAAPAAGSSPGPSASPPGAVRAEAPAPSAPAAPPADAQRRAALLGEVRAEVERCEACGLCRTRTQTVFGVGDPSARLMFVGEAPGFDEDRAGEPFVGRAGMLLDDMIRAMGLRREQVYIANVIKCRPPDNRVPDAVEIARCSDYLRRQIAIVRPQAICALGAVAARTLLGSESTLGALRGRFHELEGIPLRVTYHPAYLLRKPEDKPKAWEDLKAVMQRLGLELPPPGSRARKPAR